MQKFINPSLIDMMLKALQYMKMVKTRYEGIKTQYTYHWFVNIDDKLIACHPEF